MANQATPVIQVKDSNVGIGTTSPTRKLQITDGEVYVRFNPTSVAGTYILGAADGKFYFIPESTFVPTMTLVSGNVLIGTTTDAGQKLQVSGSASLGTGSGNEQGLYIKVGSGFSDYSVIRFYHGGTNTQTIHSFSAAWQGGTIYTSSADSININGASGVTMGAWPSPDVVFPTGGSSYFRNNVGIGTTTPAAKLQVVGETRSTSFTNAGPLGTGSNNARNHFTQLGAGTASPATGWIAAAFGDATADRIVIGQWTNGAQQAILGAHTANLDDWADTNYVSKNHKFYYNGRWDLTPTMTINASNNVLIGTSIDGGYKLSVAGNVAFGYGQNRPIFYDSVGGNFQIKGSVGGWSTGYFFQGSGGTYRGGWGALGGNDDLSYLWAGDAYDTPTMVVQGGQGNVGIGTTTPSTKLQISGSAAQNLGLLNVNMTGNALGGVSPAAVFNNQFGNHSYGIVSIFKTGSSGGNDRPSLLFYSDLSASSWQVGQVTAGWGTNDWFGIGYRATNLPATFNSWPTNYLSITTGGNVLIGSTTDAGYKLDVSGNQRIRGEEGLIFDWSGSTINDSRIGRIRPISTSAQNPYAGGLAFDYYKYDGSTYTFFEGMRLNGSGQLLIGSSSSGGATLQAFGGTAMTAGWTRTLYLDANYPCISMRSSAGGNSYVGFMWDSGSNFIMNMGSSADLPTNAGVFAVNASTRNFMIGTSVDAGYKLRVSGNVLTYNGILNQGDHSNSWIQNELTAANNGAGTGVVQLRMWCSEPGVTWDWAGFGYNVYNDNGAPAGFGRVNSNFGQAYMRFSTDGSLYFYNTNTSATRVNTAIFGNDGNVTFNGAGSFAGNVFLTQDTNSLILQQSNSSTHGIVWKNLTYSKESAAIKPTNLGAWATQGIGFYTGAAGDSTTAPTLRLDIQPAGTVAVYNNVGNGVVGTNFIAYAVDADSYFRLGNNTSNSLDIQLTRSDSATMFSVNGHTGIGYFAGNVGIGTSSPDSYLSGTSGLSVYNSLYPSVGFANTSASWLWYMGGGIIRLWNNSTSETIVAHTTGNVTIGSSTTDAGYKLDVYGECIVRDDLRILNTYALVLNGTDNNWRIGRNTITDSGWLTSNTLQIVVFGSSSGQGFQVVNSNGTALFEIDGVAGASRFSNALGVGVNPSGTSGRIDASNDIVAYSTSDRRLKENITPIANALEKVKALTGVEFDWKEETKHVHGYEGHDTGVIAQEVKNVMPTAIRENESGYLSVRYEKLIGLLIEAVKEQQAEIDALKKLIK